MGSVGVDEAPLDSEQLPIPEDFCCCITGHIMEDPVSTVDGHTYERRAIEQWLAQNGTSPKTGETLETNSIFPNHIMRRQIIEWREGQAV